MPNTTNFNWATPADTDLVKDGAAAIRTLGNSIDTSFVDLKGGTTGQVLSKNTNTDLDFTWVTPNDADAIQNTIVDAKGDLITATAADTPARLASSGNNGDILTVDTSTATGLKWAAPAGGGKVLQVVQGTSTTGTVITSTTYTDSSLSVSITPSSTSSKVLIIAGQQLLATRSASKVGTLGRLVRGSTTIAEVGSDGFMTVETGGAISSIAGISTITYLDSPSTTSSTTYKIQLRLENATSSGTIVAQRDGGISTIIAMEIGA